MSDEEEKVPLAEEISREISESNSEIIQKLSESGPRITKEIVESIPKPDDFYKLPAGFFTKSGHESEAGPETGADTSTTSDNAKDEPDKTWESLREIWPGTHQDILKRRAEIWQLWDDLRLSAEQISLQMSSLSTIKRDLRELDKMGLLRRGYPAHIE